MERSNDDHTQQPDRLSSLPDTLLITILSNLPINSAAATSVLSRRWPHLWTQITHLFFQPWTNNHRDNFHQFMNTVNHVLFYLTSSKLHTFHLSSPRTSLMLPDQAKDCLAYLYPWIHFICRCNPEVIKVNLSGYFYDLKLDLPLCLFQTQSLVNLELIYQVEFRFPVNLPVNLPNLKKLHLFLRDSNCHVIGTSLFKSCPILKDLCLFLRFDRNNYSFDIFVPNLKNLRLSMSGTNDCKFIINAPKLERLEINGTLATYELVTVPSKLQQVEISPRHAFFDNNELGKSVEKLRLFLGISCVRSLILGGQCGISMLPILNDIPNYRNLVHLSIKCDDTVDWCRPKLRCWWDNLKKIDVKAKLVVVQDMKLLYNLLSSATALEQLNVSLLEKKADEEDISMQQQLWDEYTFCRELFERKRSSSSCVIQFSGNVVTASSTGFNYSALTCQIKE